MLIRFEPIVKVNNVSEVLYYEALLNTEIPNEILFDSVNQKLEWYILQKVVDFIRNNKLKTSISVNISKSTIIDRYENITDILLVTPNLFLEVLEKDGNSYTPQKIEKLRNIGTHLIIDDFGSRLSNIDVILQIHPFAVKCERNMLKFDNDFLRTFRNNLDNWGVVTIFEKVETEEEYKRVQLTHFEYAQGYYFKRCSNFVPNNPIEEVTYSLSIS